MSERPTGTRIVVLLLVVGLVAAGCRGEDGSGAAEEKGDGDAPTARPDPDDPDDGADDGEGADDAAQDGIQSDVGVTEEPCPATANEDNGCIYLGIISDLTVGPYPALARPITDAQRAFWQRVNEDGGISGYDIDTETWVRDNEYSPEVHAQMWQEMRDEVLALAQTLGSPTTAAILDDLDSRDVVSAPAGWTSGYLFEDVILESGNTYCVESMNALDWALEREDADIRTVMAVHNAGDYGDDAAAGLRIAAEAHGLEFIDAETEPGQENQGGVVARIVSERPDFVMVATGPTDLAVIVSQSAAQGFQGLFYGNGPSWSPGLLGTAAADALKALYKHAGPWQGFDSETPGHRAMREALGDVEGNDGYTSGWIWQYPLLSALEKAAADGDLTRSGLRRAVSELTEVDYEGTLPEGSGNLAGDPNDTAVRTTVISEPSDETASGTAEVEVHYLGPTAEGHEFTEPCYAL